MWGVSDSHAFYKNESAIIPLVNAKVGDFLNPTEGNIDKTSDINILIYMQSQYDTNNYVLVNKIPVVSFVLDEKKSNCIPDSSKATYSNYSINGTELKLTVKEGVPNQVVCRMFYNKTSDTDVTIYALVEDSTYGTIGYENRKYRYVSKIPDSTLYTYYKYSCKESGTTISYADNNITFKSSKPNTCNVYFNKC